MDPPRETVGALDYLVFDVSHNGVSSATSSARSLLLFVGGEKGLNIQGTWQLFLEVVPFLVNSEIFS